MRTTRTQNKCCTIVAQLSKVHLLIKAEKNIVEEKEEAER